MTAMLCRFQYAGLILGLHPANERRRYKVTPSLIGWAQTWNQSWMCYQKLVNKWCVCFWVYIRVYVECINSILRPGTPLGVAMGLQNLILAWNRIFFFHPSLVVCCDFDLNGTLADEGILQ